MGKTLDYPDFGYVSFEIILPEICKGYLLIEIWVVDLSFVY